MIQRLVIVLMLLAFGRVAGAQGVIWDEQSQGDLSGDRLMPTALTLSPGDNLLFGIITGDDGTGRIDRDYFSVTIPSGYRLTQLVFGSYLSKDAAAFIGIQPGPVFPNAPEGVTPGDLLGWAIFGAELVGSDILPIIGSNGQGFTPPLEAGTFSFWVQQTGEFTEWSADFVVEEVPAPGSVSMLVIAASMTGIQRRGGRQHARLPRAGRPGTRD